MNKLISKLFYLLILFIFLKAIIQTIRINNINNADSYILTEESCQIIELIAKKDININNNICTINNLEFTNNLNIFDSNYIVKYQDNEFLIEKNNLVSYTVISH